jgi:uncharacterized protein YecE (DUF72 family)
LKEVQEAWKIFIENAINLEEKLGPILFQLPPSFKVNPNNIKRLEDFLKSISKSMNPGFVNHYAFEFRHNSWCDKKVYQLLKKYNAAWVIADSPSYPKAEIITANFVYVRLHGSKILFSSNYTKRELDSLAQKIKKWQKKGLDVYAYFNNDAMGYAVENAKTLKEMLENKSSLKN